MDALINKSKIALIELFKSEIDEDYFYKYEVKIFGIRFVKEGFYYKHILGNNHYIGESINDEYSVTIDNKAYTKARIKFHLDNGKYLQKYYETDEDAQKAFNSIEANNHRLVNYNNL